MDKIEVTKKVVSLVVGGTVGHCVTSMVTNSLVPKNVREKVEVAIGAYVVGAMVADAAKDWTDKQLDDLIEWYYENIHKKF